MITRFRSGDAAWAAAKKLSDLVPGHDYEAWPDRGCWVLVMRYRDDDGHLRFKFVGPEDRLSKKHDMQEKTRGPRAKSSRLTQARTIPAAIRKNDPQPTTSVTVVTKAPDDTAGPMSKRWSNNDVPRLKRFPASAVAMFLNQSAGSRLPRSWQILRARKTLARAHCPD